MMLWFLKRYPTLTKLSFSFMFLMVGLAVFGGIREYSPIPYMDMWSVLYFMYPENATLANWLHQHNEHRIILARAAFWLDQKAFGGLSLFLISFNYMIAAGSAWLFCLFLGKLEGPFQSRHIRQAVMFLIFGVLFFWSQNENFTWSFQVQFFLVQFLPLLSLYYLAKAKEYESWFSFGIAWLGGILSVGAMANGVLAFPLMVICSFIIKDKPIKIFILFVSGVICITSYLNGYITPSGHGNLLETLLTHPVAMLHYTLVYLGNPFYFIGGGGAVGRFSALGAGILFSLSSLWIGKSLLFRESRPSWKIALFCFVIYIGGTAFITAGGRVLFGIDQALSSRYSTPALMAWVALLMLVFEKYHCFQRKTRIGASWLVAVGCFIMLVVQATAFRPVHDMLKSREIAVLGLALGIPDETYQKSIFPSVPFVLAAAQEVMRSHLSVFGHYPLTAVQEDLGKVFSSIPENTCQGSFLYVTELSGTKNYARISGWISSPDKNSPKLIRFLNPEKVVVGFAIPDAGENNNYSEVDASALNFIGYIRSSALSTALMAITDDSVCRSNLTSSVFISDLDGEKPLLPSLTLDLVTNNTNFNGENLPSFVIPEMKILSSWVTSDADTGKLRLSVINNDTFYYHSGPTRGHQFLNILGTNRRLVLPTANNWVRIRVGETSLAERFEIEIEDAGNGWGEWSAIALRNP